MYTFETGVSAIHSAEWIYEDILEGIDLDLEHHKADCPLCSGFLDGTDYERPCETLEMWGCGSPSTVLIGFEPCDPLHPECMFRYVGEYGCFAYKVDKTAEYSAIVGEVNVQVVYSQFVRLSPFCSPCYPGQGDNDSHPLSCDGGIDYTFQRRNGPIFSYCLPPTVVGDHGNQSDYGRLIYDLSRPVGYFAGHVYSRVRQSDESDPQHMTIQQALTFLQSMLTPGSPPLGHWFGWFQPDYNSDGEVKLGTAAILTDSFTLGDILQGTELGYYQASRLLKMAAKIGGAKRPRNVKIEPVLVCFDEVFYPFGDLDTTEQILAKLRIVLLNTFTEGHNWACEYGDYLAETYAYNRAATFQGGWVVDDSHTRQGEIIGELLDWDIIPPLNSFASYPHYTELKGSEFIQDWMTNGEYREGSPFVLDEFLQLPEDMHISWGEPEIIAVIAWIVDWLVREYNSGNLAFISSEGLPESLENLV